MAKKDKGINPDLEKTISQLLKDVESGVIDDVDTKLKVIDRAINLEKIKQKINDDAYGSGFFGGEEE
jgi:hypothetical protein